MSGTWRVSCKCSSSLDLISSPREHDDRDGAASIASTNSVASPEVRTSDATPEKADDEAAEESPAEAPPLPVTSHSKLHREYKKEYITIPCTRDINARVQSGHEIIDLDQTIEKEREALNALRDGESKIEVNHRFSRLGRLHYLRFQCCGRPEDISLAITYQTMCLEAKTLDDDFHRAMLHADLGVSLFAYFEQFGHPWTLEAAIKRIREAIDKTPLEAPIAQKAFFHRELGVMLLSRFHLTEDRIYMDQALEEMEMCQKRTSVDNPELGSCLILLIQTHLLRFEKFGVDYSFEMALFHQGKAAELVGKITDTNHRASALDTFAVIFSKFFEKTGRAAHVEKAIEYAEAALRITSSSSPRRAKRLNRLLHYLLGRFEAFRIVGDIATASNLIQQIRSIDGYRPKYKDLHSLGKLLMADFERLPRQECIDGAVEYLQASLQRPMRAKEAITWSQRYNDLGRAFTMRFEQSELWKDEDIEHAVECHRDALNLNPGMGRTGQSHRLCLAAALGVRFEVQRRTEDIVEAIALQMEVIESITPPTNPYRVEALYGLGHSYLRKHKLRKVLGKSIGEGFENGEEAISRLREASTTSFGFPHDRLRAALLWASAMHAEAVDEKGFHRLTCLRWAVEGYEQSIALLQRIASVGLSAVQRLAQLCSIPKALASDAAACAFALAADDHLNSQKHMARAVELLDQGRSVFWSQAAQLRPNLEKLYARDAALARRLDDVARELDNQGFTDENSDEGGKAHSELAQRWESLLNQVHHLAGFENFLLPTSFEELRDAEKSATIVVVNISSFRCDALIIPPEGDLQLVPLPEATPEDIDDLAENLLQALASPSRTQCVAESKAVRRNAGESTTRRQVNSSVLYPLWDKVCEPILQSLRTRGILRPDGEPPHIRWCLTGRLAFLPIHAACPRPRPRGQSDAERQLKEPAMLDRVVSSYIPTLSSLLRAKNTQSHAEPHIVAIAQSGGGGDVRLPYAEKEIKQLFLLAGEHRVTSLVNSQATVQAVSEALRHSTWVHFACHGRQDPFHPMRSALKLHDGPLPVSQIARLASAQVEDEAEGAQEQMWSSTGSLGVQGGHRRRSSRQRHIAGRDFAMLLACESAKGSVGLTDEAIHIAAGLHFAGYSSCIATSWSIRDDLGPILTERVYRYLFRKKDDDTPPDPREAAFALRKALIYLRDDYRHDGVKLSVLDWAPFIHFGV